MSLLRPITVLAFVAAAFTAPVAAGPEEAAPSIRAVRTESPPVVDGLLDDACWSEAPVATDFTEHKTDRLAEEQTFARVLYDDEFVYVAFECIEPEPEKIQATERKYDRPLWEDDWVEVQFDTFHDHRSRYIFVMNTLGTRYDARISVHGWNVSWDCDWTGACTVGKDRWFAEMAIPIGELHFLRGDNVTWGINFHREEKGRQEESTWSYRSDQPYSPRMFGELTGLDLSRVAVNRKPRFETYVSGTGRTKGGGNEASTGLDLSLRAGPRLISAFTINPDFGQVEADPDTIELRDTERFLTERRPFFKEGAELFDTPINVYYSRRLWDIDAGAKVTGVGPDWNLGLLSVDGVINRSGKQHDGNYTVGRLTLNVGGDSQVGAIAVNSDRDDGYNRVAGLDSCFYLSDTSTWTSQILGMLDEEEVVTIDEDGRETKDTVRRDGYAFETSLYGGERPFYWGIDLTDISEDFQPDLGYVPRRDIRGMSSWVELSDHIEQGPVKFYSVQSYFTFYENHDGNTVLRDYLQRVGVEFRNEFEFWIMRSEDYHAPYKNHETRVRLAYNVVDRWHSIRGDYSHGVFEEVPYDEFSLEKPLKLGERFTTLFEGNYRIEYRDDGARDVWLWRWVSEYTFRWDGRVKMTVENSSEDRHNFTLLFSWLPRKDFDLYVVLSDWRSGEEQEQGVFAKVVRRF